MRYALRALIKSPAFTIAAMLTLAVGIGANTALFTIADPLLTRPLPVERPGELVLFRTLSSPEWPDADARVPYALFERLRSGSAAFEDVLVSVHERSAQRMRLRRERQDDLGQLVWAVEVSGSYFRTLGIGAALGRVFTADEDRPGAQALVVISDAFWRRHYGADPAIVGQQVRIDEVGLLSRFGRDGLMATVIGVAPRAFTGIDRDIAADLWMTMTPAGEARVSRLSFEANPFGGTYRAVARLRPGVRVSQAQAEVDVLTASVFDRFSRDGALRFERVAAAQPRIRVEAAAAGFSRARDQFRLPVLILVIASGVVLIVACVNVAALLLTRGTTRHREIAVRLSLGGSRFAIARLVLAESAILAAGGGALALLVAQWGHLAIGRLLPPELAVIAAGGLDVRVLGFTAVAALVSMVLSTFVPAAWISRLDLNRLLKERDQSGSPARLHAMVLTVQVALALVLLVGAGLFLQTVRHLRAVPTGVDRDRVIQLAIDARDDFRGQLTGTGLGPPVAGLLERLEALPGVRSMTHYVTSGRPLLEEGERERGRVTIRPSADAAGDALTVSGLSVGSRFFETMGIVVIAGRPFAPEHTVRDPVAVISASLARRLFGGTAAALGRPVHVGGEERQVVGIVEDVPRTSLRDLDLWTVYQPAGPSFLAEPNLRLVLRTEGDAARMVPAVQDSVREFSTFFEIADIQTFRDITERSIATERMAATLVGTLGLLAVCLVAIGIYGVVAYTVAQRTKEIGVRMALGAQPGQVIVMVVRQVQWVVALGLAVGVMATVAASQLLESLLFGVTATDPATVMAAALVLIGAAGMAAWLPARRAARTIDPIAVLRE